MKKLMFIAAVAFAAASLAGPHPGPRPAPVPHCYRPHHPAPPPPPHHNWHGSYWSGFVGGLVGGAVVEALKPTPTVVTTPVVVAAPAPQPAVIIQSTPAPKQIWVDGRYEDHMQANGTILRVWVPGHWVTVQ